MALVVFTGGARSGKSGAAQRLVSARSFDGAPVAVVVFGREGVDSEFDARVARHRAERPPEWHTIEATQSDRWRDEVPEGSVLLLDCLGTLLGLCMEEAFEASTHSALAIADADAAPPGFEAAVGEMLDRSVEWMTSRAGDTVVVTNEVGDGIVPGYATGRVFRDTMGRANRRLVDAADAAYLCVAGRLVDLTRLSRDARWPRD